MGQQIEVNHPYHKYNLEDALKLASQSKRQRAEVEKGFEAARAIPDLTTDDLQEAIDIVQADFKAASFNWITGRVALEVLRKANGEDVTFTA